MKIPRLAAVLLLSAWPLSGQQFEIYRQFVWPGGGAAERPTVGSDGNIYATGYGGDYGRGQIFRLVPDGSGGYTYERLYSFHGPDGIGPNGIIEGSDGRFYGATIGGGALAGGTVYAFDAATRELVVFHSFPLHPFYGQYVPSRLIQASDGNFYGSTWYGGPTGLGTIFRVTPTGEFTEIHGFTGPDGERPVGPLMQASDGFLYGAAGFGGLGLGAGEGPTGFGLSGGGTLFRSDLSGNTVAIYKFPGHDNYFNAELVEAPDGDLYGTASSFGDFGAGSVFRSDKTGASVTVVHSFPSVPSEGTGPIGGLTLAADGSFYGVTGGGGDGGAGTVYRITTDGTVTTVASFSGTAAYPDTALAREPSGTFLGVTGLGGAFSSGILFRVSPPATGYASLFDFGAPPIPTFPASQLVQTGDGTLWGTAGAGFSNQGTIYRLSGGPLVAHEFSGAADGSAPGNLYAAADGSLYGVTADQGPGGKGTIFRLDADGTFTTLHAFSGPDGREPGGGLMQASDGNFYGTTAFGGANDGGTLYRMTSSGTHTKLHDFLANAVPEEPRGRIIQAADGLLYFGLFGFRGWLYRSDLDGNVTDLHDFCCGDGENPPDGVIQGDDGSFYGTTRDFGGGQLSLGTVFRFTLPSTYEVLHSFDGYGRTLGTATQGLDGRLYGTATGELVGGPGGVWGMDVTGANFSWIRLLSGYDGDTPAATLLRAADGMLYGATQRGGANASGLVFRLDLLNAPPSLGDVAPASGTASGGVSLTLTGDHFRPGLSAAIGAGAVALEGDWDRETHFALTPPLTPGTIYDVTVTNTDGQSATLPQAFFADFVDSPTGSLFHDEIEAFLRGGLTAGCGGGSFCVNAAVTRAQMAVFVLKYEHGPTFVPPQCTGVFPDVPCPSMFADWIEQFASEKVTAGCGGGLYCPNGTIPRENAAVFLLKAEHGGSYVPPVCHGVFQDVTCPSTYADWIEQLAAEGISGGCGNGNYCPDANTTRGQMAAFLEKTAAQAAWPR
jgi:uncharacterized repeat protein (TIGR03803 family)